MRLACLRLAAALLLSAGAAAALSCPNTSGSTGYARLPGLAFDGRVVNYNCSLADYLDCYREATCWSLRHPCTSDETGTAQRPCGGGANTSAVAFVTFYPSHETCVGQSLCRMVSELQAVKVEPAAEAGAHGSAISSDVSFNMAMGLAFTTGGSWLDAARNMLLSPQDSCNYQPEGTGYEDCQEQCIRNGECSAWMFGFNPEFGCERDAAGALTPYNATDGSGCPNKPFDGLNGWGCGSGGCLLFKGYYRYIEYDAGGRSVPGQMVGIIPGRPNPFAGTNPDAPTEPAIPLGDMYAGRIGANSSLTAASGAGHSLADLAFDYAGPTNSSTLCDASGTCSLSVTCDLFVNDALTCGEMCKALNEYQAATTMGMLGKLPDADTAELGKLGLPSCNWYRWTEKTINCPQEGLKTGECLLVSTVGTIRQRSNLDNTLAVQYGTMSRPSPKQKRGLLAHEEGAAPQPPCNSTFFSLPKLVVAGETHLAAYQEGADEEMRAFALAYCQQRDAMFGSVGTVRRGVLPTKLAAHGGAISTYSPGSRAVCRGADCAFVAVFECVPEGARACSVDEAGNIGIGNFGSNNVGHFNVGSGNLGSRNTGDSNMGDMNAASACVGSYSSADGSFGYAASGSLVAPKAQA
ncbi:PPE family PPE42 [Micractinium conductrix]|uniref:PPE family PPE42 n=1 Tax=Micractinium conductrix TaxID=554055 RepID=A0A2P6VD34_9CHLO|nr:PPE family PPE42 [Micractinium conductrix]|eukprot:PSC71994.1 PPE family PPE42 [Micractinium conductrix]